MKQPAITGDRHGDDGPQCQREQRNRELCVAEPIVLLEHRDMRRPHAESKAIPDKERGNSSSRGGCRAMIHYVRL